jgi:hypothetical protein
MRDTEGGDADRPGALRRALAAICHHCPVCEYGRRRPDSFLGRILHHPWHADHCPFWKVEQQAYPPAKADAGVPPSHP